MNADMPPPTDPQAAPSGTPRPRGGWKSLALITLAVLGASQAANWWRDEKAAAALRHVQPADITLYTTSTCPYCEKARDWLSAHGIPWRECNVETDAACMKTFEARGSPGVPLVNARGAWHLGFDPAWIGEALAGATAGAAQPSPTLDSSPRP